MDSPKILVTLDEHFICPVDICETNEALWTKPKVYSEGEVYLIRGRKYVATKGGSLVRVKEEVCKS